jgi:hypothetical protein
MNSFKSLVNDASGAKVFYVLKKSEIYDMQRCE